MNTLTGPTISTRRPKHNGQTPPRFESFLTRTEASDLIGCSKETLVNYERRGLLKQHRAMRADASGLIRMLILYDPVELGRLPRRLAAQGPKPGEAAARAFELFDLGRPIREVVVEIRELPAQVREWHAEWQQCGGAAITVADVARDQLVALVGEFQDVAGLVERVRVTITELAARAKTSASKQ